MIFYRIVDAGVIEIARVLHQRMESSRQLGTGAEDIEKPEAGRAEKRREIETHD